MSANLLLFYDRARLPPRVPLSGVLLFVVMTMSSKLLSMLFSEWRRAHLGWGPCSIKYLAMFLLLVDTGRFSLLCVLQKKHPHRQPAGVHWALLDGDVAIFFVSYFHGVLSASLCEKMVHYV